MVAHDRSTDEPLLTPGEVALVFDVSTKTVGRWGDRGVLPTVRTSGGHRRFRPADVEALGAALGVVRVQKVVGGA
ncbi:MAG: helix-turn-helix domain-containing protein [Acidimicrobiales bacterium]